MATSLSQHMPYQHMPPHTTTPLHATPNLPLLRPAWCGTRSTGVWRYCCGSTVVSQTRLYKLKATEYESNVRYFYDWRCTRVMKSKLKFSKNCRV